MKYYKAEFTIECSQELKSVARELLADTAGEVGFESFVDTEAGIDGYIQVELFHKEQLDAAIAQFVLPNANISYVISSVIDENWNKQWEDAGFDPIDIDGRMLVFDAKRPIPTIERDIEIGIEALNAFGTGNHETTRLMLSGLMTLDIVDKRVLDCGCGTGILGIAAAKLGAADIVGYDIDEWSVRNAQHNAMLNGVTNMSVMEGDSSVLSHTSGVFDIIVANINRNTLLADMPSFKEVMNVGGLLVLSGFYQDDAKLLEDKAHELGLKITGTKTDNNWCMMMFCIDAD